LRSATARRGWHAALRCGKGPSRLPCDDPALRSLHAEGVKSLQWTALLRRVLAVATNLSNLLCQATETARSSEA